MNPSTSLSSELSSSESVLSSASSSSDSVLLYSSNTCLIKVFRCFGLLKHYEPVKILLSSEGFITILSNKYNETLTIKDLYAVRKQNKNKKNKFNWQLIKKQPQKTEKDNLLSTKIRKSLILYTFTSLNESIRSNWLDNINNYLNNKCDITSNIYIKDNIFKSEIIQTSCAAHDEKENNIIYNDKIENSMLLKDNLNHYLSQLDLDYSTELNSYISYVPNLLTWIQFSPIFTFLFLLILFSYTIGLYTTEMALFLIIMIPPLTSKLIQFYYNSITARNCVNNNHNNNNIHDFKLVNRIVNNPVINNSNKNNNNNNVEINSNLNIKWKIVCERSACELVELAEFSIQNNWELVKNTQGVAVYKRLPANSNNKNNNNNNSNNNSSLPAFMGIGIVRNSVMACLDLLAHTENKSDYDIIFDSFNLIQEIDENTKIEQHLYWAPFFVKQRDFVLLGHACRIKNNNSILLIGKSVLHPLCPVTNNKYCRANLNIGGFILQPIPRNNQIITNNKHITTNLYEGFKHNDNNNNNNNNDNTNWLLVNGWCIVYFLAQCDLCGELPLTITNKIGVKQPELIIQIRKIVEKEDITNKLDYYKEKLDTLPIYDI